MEETNNVTSENLTASNETQRAFYLNAEIKDIRNQTEKVVQMCTFELGKRLKEMRDDKLYQLLGFKTFLAYLNDPELQFSQATAYNSISLYETYQLKLGVTQEETAGISLRRLIELLPVVVQENVHEWISKAKNLSYSDLKKELHENKQNGTEFVPFPKIKKCSVCHGWLLETDNPCICQKQ